MVVARRPTHSTTSTATRGRLRRGARFGGAGDRWAGRGLSAAIQCLRATRQNASAAGHATDSRTPPAAVAAAAQGGELILTIIQQCHPAEEEGEVERQATDAARTISVAMSTPHLISSSGSTGFRAAAKRHSGNCPLRRPGRSWAAQVRKGTLLS